uniref:Uncharacterized protein n=1 Tax=Laticauda laticaudata TaxID=8630 RepID=A0A8C5S186_LATLA
RLAQDGAHVLVSSRKQAKVDQTVSELQAESLSVSGLVCHVGKSEDRQHLVDVILDINVKATALLINLVAPHMQKRGFLRTSDLTTQQTALLGLTRNLPSKLAPHIRVNCARWLKALRWVCVKPGYNCPRVKK